MTRKGISFTLTLVVIGVVLLMTALTVIVVGGGEITSFFRNVGGSQLDATVAEECGQLAATINNNYCSYYTNGGSCGDVQPNPSNSYTSTATQNNCNWLDNAGNVGLSSVLDGGRPTVTVQGNTYDCIEENEMTPACPA